MYSLRISKHSWRALVGSNSKTLNKEKLSHPLKKRDISFFPDDIFEMDEKRDISFQRIHFFYYICISLLKIEDL